MTSASPFPLAVLFVCTGNVCRSPMAELLLRAHSTRPVTVASAGMHALVGQEIDPPCRTTLAELGVEAAAHRSQQFEVGMAVDSDLVLTAERAHRDDILTRAPTLYRRVFTMKEFARLAGPHGSATPAEVVAATAARRGQVEAVTGADDDIVDPFRGSLAQARVVAAQILRVVRAVTTAFGLDQPAAVRARAPYGT